MHKQGYPLGGFDFDVEGQSDSEVKVNILANEAYFLKIGITRMESPDFAATWTHLDRKPTGMIGKIHVFKP